MPLTIAFSRDPARVASAHVRTVLPGLERLYLNDLMRTKDAPEGLVAFLGKRASRWKDR